MTFEEAYQTAAKLLEQRGQMLNGHLLRLVQGDKDLFREVRESLIRDGLAEDRAGIGLAAKAVAVGADHETFSTIDESLQTSLQTDPREDLQAEQDWWLMVSGRTRGPFDFETLLRMQRLGEIAPGDVIRCGTRGLWLQQSELHRLHRQRGSAIIKPETLTAPATTGWTDPVLQRGLELPADSRPGLKIDNKSPETAVAEASEPSRQYLPPEKIWSKGDLRRPSWLRQAWDSIAILCGGSKRLIMVLFTLASISLLIGWWRQPPPVNTIYREFTECNSALQKLRERRIGRSEWAPTVNRFRPRVKSIVSRLQFRRSAAEKELYFAGTHGLLPLLEIPADPTNAERAFDKHMASARMWMDAKAASPQSAAQGK